MLSNLAGWHVLILAVVLAAVVLWVIALVSIARSDRSTGTERAVWILIVIVAPVVGAILWFAIGPRMRSGGIGTASPER